MVVSSPPDAGAEGAASPPKHLSHQMEGAPGPRSSPHLRNAPPSSARATPNPKTQGTRAARALRQPTRPLLSLSTKMQPPLGCSTAAGSWPSSTHRDGPWSPRFPVQTPCLPPQGQYQGTGPQASGAEQGDSNPPPVSDPVPPGPGSRSAGESWGPGQGLPFHPTQPLLLPRGTRQRQSPLRGCSPAFARRFPNGSRLNRIRGGSAAPLARSNLSRPGAGCCRLGCRGWGGSRLLPVPPPPLQQVELREARPRRSYLSCQGPPRGGEKRPGLRRRGSRDPLLPPLAVPKLAAVACRRPCAFAELHRSNLRET